MTNELRYLEKYLRMSPAAKGREVARECPLTLLEWLHEHPINDETEEARLVSWEKRIDPHEPWETIHEVVDDIPDDLMEEFLGSKEASRAANELGAESPTFMHLDYKKTLRNAWLIHFTKSAHSIARKGFTHGVSDLSRLGLTTEFRHQSKAGGGYNFAYRVGDAHRFAHQGGYGRGRWKYGDEAVVFQASGVLVHHYGDQEDQVIFVGSTAHNIIPITEEDDKWVVASVKSDRPLYRGETPDEAAEWIRHNIRQYRRQLVQRASSRA